MTESSDRREPGAGKPGTGKAGAGKAGTGKAGAGKADTGKAGAGKEGAGKSGDGKPNGTAAGRPGDSWEQRASDVATDIQRWLIRASARNMRDELGDQVRKAFRGEDTRRPGDVWETATTEPPHAADEPPECAWCPVCRAAPRIADARTASARAASSGSGGGGGSSSSGGGGGSSSSGGGGGSSSGGGGGGGSVLADAADVMASAIREALAGLDSVLSYRPGETSQPDQADRAESAADSSPDSADDQAKGPERGPDHRG